MVKKSKAVTVAAKDAARFMEVERVATEIHQEQTGKRLVRSLLKGGKLSAVITDGKSTLEVMDGDVALSVNQE